MLEFLNLKKYLGLPVVASEHGKNVDDMMVYVHWLMLVLFVGWLVYFGYALFRFRKSRNPKADYVGFRGHASNYIEGAVALVEGILLIGFAIPLWAKAVEQFPAEKESTVVRVMAQQFAWNVRYPGKDGIFGKQDINMVSSTNKFGIDFSDPAAKDDFETMDEIHVPINKPVIIHVSSMDVVHSFKVLSLRITQDAIPSMRVPTWFKPIKEGEYQINCAQLCGAGHASMARGFITVESQEKYDQWVAERSKTGGAPMSFE